MSKCQFENCTKRPLFGLQSDKRMIYCSSHSKLLNQDRKNLELFVYLNAKKCIHNQQKHQCNECGTVVKCIHNKIKSGCIECGGSQVCIHKKLKVRCIECGGSALCIHNQQKHQCNECGTVVKCIHNKIKSGCIECGGSRVCIHKKLKVRCIECGGSQICIHTKRKTICVECGGSQICIHKKQKSRCIECGGSDLCAHQRIRQSCILCEGSQVCHSCKSAVINTKYRPYCCRCFIHINPDQQVSKHFRAKERHVTDYIKQEFEDYKIQYDKNVPDGCSKRRPDVLIPLSTHNIIVEIDENQHISYESTCEVSRINNLFEDLDHIPLIMIRFNPDAYQQGDIKHKSCFKLDKRNHILIPDKKLIQPRLESLKTEIQNYINYIPTEDHLFKEIYLFYDTQ